MGKPRGRPRAFDERQVMEAAREAFWDKGLAGASLDAIAEATGVARPSLAAAFGDKRALYLRAVALFVGQMQAAAKRMAGAKSLSEDLTAFYEAAVELYMSGDRGQRGCLAICTMPVEAVESQEIRIALNAVIVAVDEAFHERFKRARELGPGVDARARALVASSVLFSLALRARAGATKREISQLIRAGVDLLCRK